jgi:alpha-glucosidase
MTYKNRRNMASSFREIGNGKGLTCLIIITILLFLSAGTLSAQGTDISDVSSPDGNVVAHFWWDSTGGKVYLSIVRSGTTFLKESPLGISFQTFDLGSGFSTSPSTTVTTPNCGTTPKVNCESISLMSGKRRSETYEYGKLLAVCSNSSGHTLTVEVRASNDGVAFRYSISGSSSANMTSEHTAYQLPAGPTSNTNGYQQSRFDADSNYEDDAEIRYKDTSVAGFPSEAGYPALFNMGSSNWMLLTESGVDVGYPDGHLAKDSGVNDLYHQWFRGLASWQVPLALPFTTPWRVIILGSLETLFESDLIRELGQVPEAGYNFSFVTPGFAPTSAYAGNDSYNRAAVDSAVALNMPWVSFDYTWRSDPCITGGTCGAPGGQSPLAYAHSKGLKVLLWISAAEIWPSSDPATVLNALKAYGADGTKIDFMQGYEGLGNPENPSGQYERLDKYVSVAKAAADNQMCVLFHGNSVPKGLERRFPNVLGLEGERNSEHFYDSVDGGTPTADQNNILTYTRNVIGGMDFMIDPHIELRTFQDSPTTTRGHTVAETVVFESGLATFWGGNADYVVSSLPNTKDLISGLPQAWDDIKYLGGVPAATTIVARRAGTSWYVGFITANTSASTTNISLSFLDPSPASYTATIYDDATGTCSGECITKSTPTTVYSTTTLNSIAVAAGGGFVIKFTKN